jgi:serine O-acetyltransferase
MHKLYRFVHFLVRHRNTPFLGGVAVLLLKMLGLEIPKSVKIGKNVEFAHCATGLVIHPWTVIEDNVKIFQGVTIGRADSYKDIKHSKMKGIVIKKGAVLCAGAKILCKEGILTVGENTVIGANAVLLNSTGDNEIWAGVPAVKISSNNQKSIVNS